MGNAPTDNNSTRAWTISWRSQRRGLSPQPVTLVVAPPHAWVTTIHHACRSMPGSRTSWCWATPRRRGSCCGTGSCCRRPQGRTSSRSACSACGARSGPASAPSASSSPCQVWNSTCQCMRIKLRCRHWRAACFCVVVLAVRTTVAALGWHLSRKCWTHVGADPAAMHLQRLADLPRGHACICVSYVRNIMQAASI